MKIKTEVLQTIFVVTCEGDSLNPVLIQGFVTAMKDFIQKKQLDILLDLSDVELIDSTKLGAIIHFLEKIDGYGMLVLCGVSDRVTSLLKMTNMDGKFIHAANRNDALSTLFWEKKNTSSTAISPQLESPLIKDELENQREMDDNDVEVVSEEVFEIIDDDWEIVDEEGAHEIEEAASVGDNADETDSEPEYDWREEFALEARKKGLRKFRRIKSRQISDDEIIMYCKNLNTGKHHTAVILDISLGGLLIELKPSTLLIGEELLLKGRIGRGFKFKEQAVACSYRGNDEYGLAFVNLSQDATLFLTRLIGAVK
jgi:anti-anti-sigma factor